MGLFHRHEWGPYIIVGNRWLYDWAGMSKGALVTYASKCKSCGKIGVKRVRT